MKKLLNSVSALMAAATIAILVGCSGCQTHLDPAGVYQSDTFLYNTDQSLKLSQVAIHTFVKWEYDNRAVITNTWPQVTVAADKLRAEVPGMFALAGVARNTYIQVKSQLGNNTNSASLDAAHNSAALDVARGTLQDQVNAISMRVNEAQNNVDVTTLSNKPVLKTVPVKP